MQTTIFLRTEMSRKTEYVHNPCFLSANILKILGVFAENQILFISTFDLLSLSVNMSFKTFILEHIIPNISAVIALIFLIRYIWTSNKDDSDTK